MAADVPMADLARRNSLGTDMARRASLGSTPLLSRSGTMDMRREWNSKSKLAARHHKYSSYSSDLFHTIVYQPWWRLFVLLFIIYIGSWILYAGIGFLFFPPGCIDKGSDSEYTGTTTGSPVRRQHTFRDWLNWTIQTMSTIGYGTLTPSCTYSGMLMAVMLVHGFMLDACTFGFVFAKFSAPTNMASTLLFAKRLVGTIAQTSAGALDLKLSFRLVNTRKHPVAAPDVKVYLVDQRPLDLAVPQFPRFHEIPAVAEPPLAFLEYPCEVDCHFRTPPLVADEDFTSFATATTPRRRIGTHGSVSAMSPLRGEAAEAAMVEVHTPLHELLAAFVSSGEETSIWPRAEENLALDAFSLVVLFTATIPSTGASFELRKTYSLLDTAWGCEFCSMLSDRGKREGRRMEHTDRAQIVLDISCLSKVEPLESPEADS